MTMTSGAKGRLARAAVAAGCVASLLAAPRAQAAKGGVPIFGAPAVVFPTATVTAPVLPFQVVGFLQAATLGGSTALSGGTLTVNGQTIIVPDNTVVLMPATALTWAELFRLAPAPYAPTQTGMALTDVPQPLGTYEVSVQGNRVNGQWIAGLINFSQQSLNTSSGYITYIDYITGELRVGGVVGDPTTGQRVRINDPLGKFGRVWSPDVRFTIDEDNPTIRSETAYPMCLPRQDPRLGDDLLCPSTNRPIDPVTGTYQSIFQMNPPNSGLVGLDPTAQAPFQVGDFITYSGVLMKEGAEPTVGPAPAGATFMAAYTIIANVGIFTTPGTDPAYVALDVTILGVGGAPGIFPQEATVRTKFEGFSTDPSRVVDLYGIDVDPCTGVTSDRDWGSVGVDPGPPTGAVMGRWRFAPPGKVLSLPSTGIFLPATREVRAMVRGAVVSQTANGLLAGQYHAPISEYLWPENLGIGNPPIALNLQDFAFLAKGMGPWAGGGPNPVPTGIVGQLKPFPAANPPPPVVCSTAAPTAPTAVVGPDQTVTAGAPVTLNGALSTDPNGLPLTFAWTQTAGPSATLSSASIPLPTFTAPSVSAATVLTFQLVVSDATPLSSPPVTVNVTVNPASTALQPPVARLSPTLTAPSNAVVQLNGTASFDPNPAALPLTFSWTQVVPAGSTVPTVALAGANTATPTFTAPVVPPGGSLTITFQLVVSNANGTSTPATVDVAVSPVVAPVANAGPTQIVFPGTAPVTLDGTASRDPNGLPLTYRWTQVGGTPVTLSATDVARPTFTAPNAAVKLDFALIVNNGYLDSFGALVTVNVGARDAILITAVEYRVAKQRLVVNVTDSNTTGAVQLFLQGYGAGGT
ncbi:MAG TPA: hypothetical protein VFP65_15005, partial [Anaeromyxobacteraceae bacterium]|nr:hypothetical protein [Anaeromyxobacteraceae bacterium]